MDKENLERIMNLLKEQRRFDFSVYNPSFLEKQVLHHMEGLENRDFESYFDIICRQQDQLNQLADLLTVNVSKFFRNPLVFEMILQKILPRILGAYQNQKNVSLRVWSAGCSFGEEAYSMAILIKEIAKQTRVTFETELFATDIDRQAILAARQAVYRVESIEDVRFRWLKEYFINENERYKVIPEIREMVDFSVFDLTDKKRHAPAPSIFGNFDIIMCRNVLIYFQKEYQEIILKKLSQSLAPKGYLILGESEMVSGESAYQLEQISNWFKIYQKRC